MPSARGLTAILLAVALGRALPAQQPDVARRASLQRLLLAEDARGTLATGVLPITEGLRDRDTLLRRVAVRAAGRLQRPDLARLLVPLLSDPAPAIRSEAANAIAQDLRQVRRAGPTADSTALSVATAQAALIAALAGESDGAVRDAIAEALGRLPHADSAAAREAEHAMLARSGTVLTLGVTRGMYWLALARRATGNLSPEGRDRLRLTAVRAGSVEARRIAILTLGVLRDLDSATTERTSRDRDDQIRRLALAGGPSLSPVGRAALVRRALADPSMVVRVAAIGAARALAVTPSCAPLIVATRDPHPYVRLIAIDSLGAPCADSAAAAAALARIIDAAPLAGGQDSWQVPAHALVALARIDAAAAGKRLPSFTTAERTQHRVAAAHAAALLDDRPTLLRLAADPDQNVLEAALVGLSARGKHEYDSVYIAALGAPGYQAVLAAAEGLSGTSAPEALPALLGALDRLTAERRENARDPRSMLLRRIGELGHASAEPRLMPYLTDFDTTVAATAATLLTRWTGRPTSAAPRPLPIESEPLAAVFLSPNVRLRVTLARESGGGRFEVRLFPTEAPATVARLLRRAREGYYNGLTIQRVEPNFVIQGGSPGATEYVGDAQFMRDELGMRSHARGTVGISSRGRDTGDAQFFVNLVDNPRLDHDYTVVGEVLHGRDVVERIVEGDVIQRVEILVGP
ncbi:MAG: peptidylprolyl isomerase [Gemmatimonadota bacterium]